MLAEQNEDDAIRANLLKLVRAWLAAANELEKAASKVPPGHELRRHRVFRPGWPWPERVGLTIHFPDASEPLTRSSVVKVTGTRDEAIALTHDRIHNWRKRQKKTRATT